MMMTLDELKTAIDAWEDGYLTGRNESQARIIDKVITAPVELVAQLDPARQRNQAAMAEGYGDES